MSKSLVESESLIKAFLSPHVGILSTPDVDTICKKNNLNFIEMLKPFCQISKDVPFCDPGTSSHNVKNLRLIFRDLRIPHISPASSKRQLSEVVECTSAKNSTFKPTVIPFNNSTLQIQTSLPWFDAWRHIFLGSLRQSDFEFWNRFIGVLFVTSMDTIDPLKEFKELTKEYSQFSDHLAYPKFFSSHIFRFYLLICDASRTDTNMYVSRFSLLITHSATNIFERIQTTFGTNSCHMLFINSSQEFGVVPATDPWFNFLIPPGFKARPSGLQDKKVESGENTDPLSSESESKVKPVENVELQPVVAQHHLDRPHGQCLTQHDIECLRMFIHELVSNALIPWAEITLKSLHDQVAQRSSSIRSISNFTKKIFGGGASQETTNHHSTSVYYTSDAIELQTRRYADLALLFQSFEIANSTYSLLVRQFQNDSASLHLASALEMSIYTSFLLGPNVNRTFPTSSVERALHIYINDCKRSDLALRAILLSTELLKTRNQFTQADKFFLRLAADKEDLTSALLLEQSAQCLLHQMQPEPRKYAFRMARSAYRYAQAQQRVLAIRGFNETLLVLEKRNWHRAVDHLKYNIGDQTFNLGQLQESAQALNSIFEEPRPSLLFDRQLVILKDYLRVLQKYKEHNPDVDLPTLPIPRVDNSKLRVQFGVPSVSNDITSIQPLQQHFDDSDQDQREISEILNSYGPWKMMVKWPGRSRFVLPDWFEGSDVSDLSDSDDHKLKEDNQEKAARDWLFKSVTGTGQLSRRLRMMLRYVPHSLDDDTSPSRAFLPSQQLSFNHPARQKPLSPITEKVTYFISLTNSLSVPLAMNDLRLLWRFVDR
ncbi:Trafficking protein particle complex 8 [Cichlidogyrus casuarinus]|uniref:Trafficking protein particle complex 8 n=1 Tax=Cichlidogyrus casuarinus TaxID=1844966 RepID=A0ABD2QJ61_9PLAT